MVPDYIKLTRERASVRGERQSPGRGLRVDLWDAINEYTQSCGGDTSNSTLSDRRMDAVAAVERILTKILSSKEDSL